MDAFDSARSLAKERIIDRYTQKWDDILFSIKPIDRAKAKAVIIKAYNLIDLPAPDIYFLTSPSKEQCAIFSDVAERYRDDGVVIFLRSDLINKIRIDFKEIYNYAFDGLSKSAELNKSLESFSELCWIVYDKYLYPEAIDYNANIYKILDSEHILTNLWYVDFYFENISKTRKLDFKAWKVLIAVCEECPYLVTFDRVCFVVERPCELHFFDRELLVVHADDKPAIKYADGFEIYCHYGDIVSARFIERNSIEYLEKLYGNKISD